MKRILDIISSVLEEELMAMLDENAKLDSKMSDMYTLLTDKLKTLPSNQDHTIDDICNACDLTPRELKYIALYSLKKLSPQERIIQAGSAPKTMRVAHTEPVVELKTSTLQSYKNRAVDDRNHAADSAGMDPSTAGSHVDKIARRERGIATVNDKLKTELSKDVLTRYIPRAAYRAANDASQAGARKFFDNPTHEKYKKDSERRLGKIHQASNKLAQETTDSSAAGAFDTPKAFKKTNGIVKKQLRDTL